MVDPIEIGQIKRNARQDWHQTAALRHRIAAAGAIVSGVSGSAGDWYGQEPRRPVARGILALYEKRRLGFQLQDQVTTIAERSALTIDGKLTELIAACKGWNASANATVTTKEGMNGVSKRAERLSKSVLKEGQPSQLLGGAIHRMLSLAHQTNALVEKYNELVRQAPEEFLTQERLSWKKQIDALKDTFKNVIEFEKGPLFTDAETTLRKKTFNWVGDDVEEFDQKSADFRVKGNSRIAKLNTDLEAKRQEQIKNVSRDQLVRVFKLDEYTKFDIVRSGKAVINGRQYEVHISLSRNSLTSQKKISFDGGINIIGDDLFKKNVQTWSQIHVSLSYQSRSTKGAYEAQKNPHIYWDGYEGNMEQISEAEKNVALDKMKEFFNEFKQVVHRKIQEITDLDGAIACTEDRLQILRRMSFLRQPCEVRRCYASFRY